MENSQGDYTNFEYIKEAMLKFGLKWVENKNTKAQRKTSGSYKKESIQYLYQCSRFNLTVIIECS